MVSGAEGLQTDVRQLQLLLPKLVLQLEHDFRLGLGALAQPEVGSKGVGWRGVTMTVTGHQHTLWSVQTHIYSRERKSRGENGRSPLRRVGRDLGGLLRQQPFPNETHLCTLLTVAFDMQDRRVTAGVWARCCESSNLTERCPIKSDSPRPQACAHASVAIADKMATRSWSRIRLQNPGLLFYVVPCGRETPGNAA